MPGGASDSRHAEYSLPYACPEFDASFVEATVTAHPSLRIDPDTGIPDLIRSLADDSKRLAGDEVRLAKLELHQSVRTGIRGSIQLALALAFGIVAAVALTVLLVALVSAALNHNYWAGALIVGVLELVGGFIALQRGLTTVSKPASTLA